MTTYFMTIEKNNIKDDKNSRRYDNKEALSNEYERLKEKYKATETSVEKDFFMYHGLFKTSIGTCKHGKEVEINYREIVGELCPTNLPKPSF